MTPCQTCGVNPPCHGERFCPWCRYKLQRKMEGEGYLTLAPATKWSEYEDPEPPPKVRRNGVGVFGSYHGLARLRGLSRSLGVNLVPSDGTL
jgi:hypothetical protein